MTKRNIMRFIISFIFGVLLFFRFGGETYAAETTHTCPSGKGYASNATKLTPDSTFTKISIGNTVGSYFYYLDEDVTFNDTKIIDDYTSVTICLNGHVLKGNGSAALFKFSDRYGFNQLTICDCQHDNESCTHKFTVSSEKTWNLDESSGEKSVTGGVVTNGGGTNGAILIDQGSKLNLYDVNIVGNKGVNGAIYCRSGSANINNCRILGNGYAKPDKSDISKTGGIFFGASSIESTIKNTIISYNVAADKGAGVYSADKLSMENVEISYNNAVNSAYGGSGIRLYSGTLKLKNCRIKNNTIDPYSDTSGYGAGIVCDSGSLILDGSIDISGNTRNASANNVYLKDNKILKINPGLSVTTPIGIIVKPDTYLYEPLLVTDTVTTDCSTYFKCDDASSCDIIYDENYIKLIRRYMVRIENKSPNNCWFSVENGAQNQYGTRTGIGSDSKIKVYTSYGDPYTLAGISYFIGETEYPISYNSTDNAYTFIMPAANIVIKPNFVKPNIITFICNGGHGSMEDSDTFSTTYNLPKCRFLPGKNKIFAGWSYYSTGPIINTKSINLSGDVTLYAIWENHPNHSFTDTELPYNITKKSCKCGYYIIRYN